jgi:hypothetical protein
LYNNKQHGSFKLYRWDRLVFVRNNAVSLSHDKKINASATKRLNESRRLLIEFVMRKSGDDTSLTLSPGFVYKIKAIVCFIMVMDFFFNYEL